MSALRESRSSAIVLTKATLIMDGLFVGGMQMAGDSGFLRANKVTQILVVGAPPSLSIDCPLEVGVSTVPWKEELKIDPQSLATLEYTFNRMTDRLSSGEGILVCAQSSPQPSLSFLSLYLIYTLHWSSPLVYQYIQRKIPLFKYSPQANLQIQSLERYFGGEEVKQSWNKNSGNCVEELIANTFKNSRNPNKSNPMKLTSLSSMTTLTKSFDLNIRIKVKSSRTVSFNIMDPDESDLFLFPVDGPMDSQSILNRVKRAMEYIDDNGDIVPGPCKRTIKNWQSGGKKGKEMENCDSGELRTTQSTGLFKVPPSASISTSSPYFILPAKTRSSSNLPTMTMEELAEKASPPRLKKQSNKFMQNPFTVGSMESISPLTPSKVINSIRISSRSKGKRIGLSVSLLNTPKRTHKDNNNTDQEEAKVVEPASPMNLSKKPHNANNLFTGSGPLPKVSNFESLAESRNHSLILQTSLEGKNLSAMVKNRTRPPFIVIPAKDAGTMSSLSSFNTLSPLSSKQFPQ